VIPLPLTVTLVIHEGAPLIAGVQPASEQVTFTLYVPPPADGLALFAESVYVQPFA
jgi:hypothetical protein